MTFSVPEPLALQLLRRARSRDRSRFVGEALAARLEEGDVALIRACEISNQDLDVAEIEKEFDGICRYRPGSECSRTPLGLGGRGLSALELRPKRLVGLFQRDRVPLELAFGLFEVLVDLRLMVQVECDRPKDLGAFQRREVFLMASGDCPSLNEYTTESREMRVPAT